MLVPFFDCYNPATHKQRSIMKDILMIRGGLTGMSDAGLVSVQKSVADV